MTKIPVGIRSVKEGRQGSRRGWLAGREGEASVRTRPLSRDPNDEKEPIVKSGRRASRRENGQCKDLVLGMRLAHSKGRVKVKVSVAGTWRDAGGEVGIGEVARRHSMWDLPGQTQGLDLMPRIMGGPWRGLNTGMMQSIVFFKRFPSFYANGQDGRRQLWKQREQSGASAVV